MIPGARSVQQGALDLPLTFHAPVKLDQIADYTTEVFVVDGDLDLPGDLDLFAEGAYLLVVLGNLSVGGVYRDYDDPESFLFVTGDMRARDVITAGWLEVRGSLTTGRLIGDYNDCGARIDGDVRAELFYGEEHHFNIGGELRADIIVGRPRLTIAAQPTAVIPLDDNRLLRHFDRPLLRLFEDTDRHGKAIVEVDGFRDFKELKRRVAAGLPLH